MIVRALGRSKPRGERASANGSNHAPGGLNRARETGPRTGFAEHRRREDLLMSSTSQALQRVGRIRQGLAGATGGHPGDPLYRLDPRVIWRFLRRESAAFWCINIYLFFEYVRPQSIYEAIAGPPWAQLSLIATMGALFFERRKAKPGTVADATLLLFSCVLVISCITAFQPAISFGLISEYFAWVLIFLLISNIVVTEQRFLVFMLAFVLYNF